MPSLSDTVAAMKREHDEDSPFLRASGEAAERMETFGVKSKIVSPHVEWIVVINGKVSLNSSQHTPEIPRREMSLKIQHFLDIARREYPNSNLQEAEIIALRLWTGPMYQRYAFLLRSFYLRNHDFRAPGITSMHYVTTIHALNSGIITLSRCNWTSRIIYRGLRLDLTSEAMEGLEGVNQSPLAFSVDLKVAKEYA